MKYTETSYQTKKRLAAALKQQLMEHSMSKITVGDLVDACGVNRKTFYYHFNDIHALLTWMFREELAGIFNLYDSRDGYYVLANTVFDYILANEQMFLNITNTDGEGDFIRALREGIVNLNHAVVCGFEARAGKRFEDDFRSTLIDFMSGAVIRVLKDWIEKRETRDRKRTIEYLQHLFIVTLGGLVADGKYLTEQKLF